MTALAVNPDDQHVVYAAATFTMAAPDGRHTSQSVFISVDDGLRWSVPADEVTRARVATALGLLNAETVIPQLAMRLRDVETQARRNAAETLAGIGTPEAIAALMKPLRDAELTPARYMAMQGLKMAGQSAVTPLRLALLDRDPVMRRNAAEMLGWLGATEAVPDLVQSLSDQDAAVRNQATWALGEMHTVAAQLALRQVASGEAGRPILRATNAAPADATTGANVSQSSTVFRSMWSNALALVVPGRWTLAVLVSLLALAILAAMLIWKGPRQQHLRPS